MATELKEYLVIIPDLPDVLAKRQVLLKPHNQDAAPLVKAGRVPFFGSTLAHHSPEGQQVAENGTVMIIKAESEEEIREIIRKDIFTIEGVWDFGKLSIWPFKIPIGLVMFEAIGGSTPAGWAISLSGLYPVARMRNRRDNSWVVQKFGGTSIGKFPDKVAEIVKSARLGSDRPAVICSARSSGKKVFGTTSRLLQVYRTLRGIVAITQDPDMQELLFDRLRSIIRDIRDDQVATVQIYILRQDIRDETIRQITADCQELLDYTSAAKRFNLDINGKAKDKMVSFGEKLSCRLMVAMLRDRDIPAEYVDLSDIVPSNNLDQLKPEFFHEAAAVFGKRVEACNGRVPVITGFFGTVPGSLIDSGIGRGYSDLCAVLVAIGLHAERVQIWKEVDGIFTADPREVPDARCLPSITPSEAAELTFYGSEVIHHLALSLAIQAKPPVSIFVKNVQKPWGQGTVVVPSDGDDTSSWPIDYLDPSDSDSTSSTALPKMPTAVTIKRDITIFNILSNKQSMSHGFFVKVFTILAEHDISVDLISTSEVHVSMAINSSNMDPSQIKSVQCRLSEEGEVNVLPDMAILSLVGAELKNMTGIAGRMFAILGEQHVNIEMISQGASEINISCVIPDKDATRALNMLHDELFTKSAI
ncbi:Aspartate/glutamate/uridylate kinase [Fusarium oxysporum Fo47]|nr:Aspartate/glutamate/uridylate kinase [Fusarium oxysporum Fo47]QKD52041.2 Aspartate/glutamate/uridylate kinase [Fusarium oxysporum Fo47]